MPTTRPRHTITETPDVKDALDQLRAKLPRGEKVDYAELIVLGAELKVRRLSAEEEAAQLARDRLAEMIRTRSIPVETQAAEEVKRRGLLPRYE